MDKYELNIKLEQMRKLIRRKEYNTASKIADTIEWNRIKNNQDLLMAADVYEASGKLVNAREVLLYAYERTNLGRQIVYRLCRVATKLGDIEEAEEFYSEFVRIASTDNSKYILQYEIARARGNNLDTQIAILSKFLDEEMDDRWAYELAKLYHKAGKGQDCAKMCDTIILWFSDGKYVDRALELKSQYVPLTKEQQSRVFKESIIPVIDRTNEDFDAKLILNEMQGINAEEIKVTDYSNKVGYDTVNIQKALAESMKDVFEDAEDELTDSVESNDFDEISDAAIKEVTGQMEANEQLENNEAEAKEDLEKTKEVTFGTTKIFVPISKQMLGEVEEEKKEAVEEQQPADSDDASSEEESEVPEVAIEASVEVPAQEVDDNHIEGQVTIDEVLAMFNLDEKEADESNEDDEEMQDQTEEPEEIVDEDEESANVAMEESEEDSGNMLMEEQEVEEGEPEEAELEEDEPEETEPEENEPEEAQVEETETVDEDETFDSLAEEIADIIEEKDEAKENVEDSQEELERVLQEQLEEVLEEPSEEMDSEDESEENIEEDGEEVGVNEEELESEPEYVKRNLSPDAKQELKDFISRFTGVKGIDKQILKAMHSVLRTSANESNFIFIIGDVKSGKTTLAIDIIKVLNKIMENRGRKIAKVPGGSLSGKNMYKLMDKVVESDIVVEKVSSMGEDSLCELVKAVRNSGESKIVIFEDEVITSEKFVREICDKLDVGDNIIVLKQSRIKEWAEIAKDYIREEGYEIDEMGILAMHERIDKLHALTLVIQKNHVEQVIDRAIAKHNKKKLTNLFRGNKSNVLTEKDFIED